MKKILQLLSLFIIISQQSYAQNITGLLLDAKSKQPIVGATLIARNSQEQAISSEDGSFQFNKLLHTDSLLIQHINYTTVTYPVSQLIQTSRIYLNAKIIIAPQATIQPKKYKKGVLGYRAGMRRIWDGWHTKNSRKRKYSYGLAKDWLQRNAQRIYNDYTYKGYIKKIRVGISKHGKPTTPFGVRLMTVNPLDQSPENYIIDSLFIIAAPKGNDWAELDISKFGIDIPQEGFFVVLEDLPQALDSVWYHQYTYYDTAYHEHTKIDTCFGYIYQYYSRKYKDIQDVYWHYYENATKPINDTSWRNDYKFLYNLPQDKQSNFYPKYHPNSIFLIPIVQVEIAYHTKDKKQAKSIELEQDSLSYQKLSKKLGKCLFDIPKLNQVEYSQSSPKELLESIKNGIISSNWQYVLYHLCIYPSAFVEEIAQKCKEDANNIEFQKLFSLSQQEHHQALQYIEDLIQKADANAIEKTEYNTYKINDLQQESIYFYFDGKNWYILPVTAQE